VRLYNAVSEAEKIRLNQLHKGCNSRIKMPTTCPIHGQVERSEIIKGYEFEKDKYVAIEQDELDKIKLRSEKTIELTKFVPADSIRDVYLDSAYYMAPDGPVAEEPFRVVREALEKTGTAGIGKLAPATRVSRSTHSTRPTRSRMPRPTSKRSRMAPPSTRNTCNSRRRSSRASWASSTPPSSTTLTRMPWSNW
jgi:DNA end-binding protein Ku